MIRQLNITLVLLEIETIRDSSASGIHIPGLIIENIKENIEEAISAISAKLLVLSDESPYLLFNGVKFRVTEKSQFSPYFTVLLR